MSQWLCHPLLSQFAPTDVDEVEKTIRSCPDKSCCLDPLPTNLLKKTLEVHLPPLLNIINTSFKEGKFPKCLKTAIVTHLLKKTSLDTEQLKNYRPVSNIPFLSKVLEKIAVKRLLNHLQSNDLYEVKQSAYKRQHSTETALLKVQNDIACALDKKKDVVLLMLDLSAAFDTADHNQLLSVLGSEFSVTDKDLSWFSSHLKGRTQRVKIGSDMSDYLHLKCGVPQGSVIGPIMFILLTTSLRRIFKKYNVFYHKYADDIQLYVIFDPSVPSDREREIRRM